jgi:hypothetical protein
LIEQQGKKQFIAPDGEEEPFFYSQELKAR